MRMLVSLPMKSNGRPATIHAIHTTQSTHKEHTHTNTIHPHLPSPYLPSTFPLRQGLYLLPPHTHTAATTHTHTHTHKHTHIRHSHNRAHTYLDIFEKGKWNTLAALPGVLRHAQVRDLILHQVMKHVATIHGWSKHRPMSPVHTRPPLPRQLRTP